MKFYYNDIMIKFLDIEKNYLSIKDEIDKSISENIIHTQFINGQDKQIFEYDFANYIGTKYCIGVANGTDAIEIAIQSLELTNGEIITQPNSYISTALGITNNRLTPVFVDIDEDTMMIDINKIEEKITNQTRVICFVNLYGCSPDIDKIVEIANKYIIGQSNAPF